MANGAKAVPNGVNAGTGSRPQRAGIYCRISYDEDRSGLGVARQKADCEELCSRKGWDVAEVYVENDTSATRAGSRPIYGQLVEDIKVGLIDAVVVWDLDRLYRHPRDLEDLFEVCDAAGLRHLATVGGDVDLSTGDGMLMARIKGAVGAEEVRKISQRSQRKKLELAQAGKPHGGRRAFGFEGDGITHVPEEAEAVRDAARRVLAGEPLKAIVRTLNDAGPSTVTGAIWRTNAVKAVLTAPRIAGMRQHQGEVVGPAVWKPILDLSTWQQVKVVLEDPRRRASTFSRKYLLSGGLIRCGKCGRQLAGKPRKSHPSYFCPPDRAGCGGTWVKAAPTEELVCGMVLTALDHPEFRAALQASDGGNTELVDTSADEAKLLEFADDYDEGRITRKEWLRLRGRVEARLAAAHKQIATARRRSVLEAYGDLRADWQSMTLDQRRAVLGEVIEHVVVGPAVKGRKTYDPARLTLVWRS